MKYDFTSILDRTGRDAMAVDGLGKMPGFAPDRPKEGFDVIPMWVADMNFPTAPFQHPWAIRMNLALPLSQVQKAFKRLKEYVFL